MKGSRLLWQQESNAASEAEYDALLPLLQQVRNPEGFWRLVLAWADRSSFSARRDCFTDSEISLYDADGTSTRYKQKYYEANRRGWPDTSSFCGNLPLLRTMLDYNGVKQYQIFDAQQLPLAALPGLYDLIYGSTVLAFTGRSRTTWTTWRL